MESIIQYLVVSMALFSIGVYGLITKRTAIRMLFSLEIISNSAVLNLIVFSRYIPDVSATGQVIAIFFIALLAAEAAVGLSIILVAFRIRKDIDVLEMREMKE